MVTYHILNNISSILYLRRHPHRDLKVLGVGGLRHPWICLLELESSREVERGEVGVDGSLSYKNMLFLRTLGKNKK